MYCSWVSQSLVGVELGWYDVICLAPLVSAHIANSLRDLIPMIFFNTTSCPRVWAICLEKGKRCFWKGRVWILFVVWYAQSCWTAEMCCQPASPGACAKMPLFCWRSCVSGMSCCLSWLVVHLAVTCLPSASGCPGNLIAVCLLGTCKADLNKKRLLTKASVLAVTWLVPLCKFRLVSVWIKERLGSTEHLVFVFLSSLMQNHSVKKRKPLKTESSLMTYLGMNTWTFCLSQTPFLEKHDSLTRLCPLSLMKIANCHIVLISFNF